MALNGHRHKTKSGRWSKRAKGKCKYGKLAHPVGRRICKKRRSKR